MSYYLLDSVILTDSALQNNEASPTQKVNAYVQNRKLLQSSAKVFCFGHMHSLSELETLHCFAEHYQSVLQSPEDNSSHLNIRSFMKHRWEGLLIDFDALKIKS